MRRLHGFSHFAHQCWMGAGCQERLFGERGFTSQRGVTERKASETPDYLSVGAGVQDMLGVTHPV